MQRNISKFKYLYVANNILENPNYTMRSFFGSLSILTLLIVLLTQGGKGTPYPKTKKNATMGGLAQMARDGSGRVQPTTP
jgi:hypothetical protein